MKLHGADITLRISEIPAFKSSDTQTAQLCTHRDIVEIWMRNPRKPPSCPRGPTYRSLSEAPSRSGPRPHSTGWPRGEDRAGRRLNRKVVRLQPRGASGTAYRDART